MDFAGPLHIQFDLRPQCVERFEPALVADVLDEIDLDMPTVNLIGKIEQMHFEQQTIIAVDGRPIPNVGDTSKWLRTQSQHLNSKHATQRCRATQQAHVQGWKPNRSASLVPVRHSPTNAITPPQAARGMLQVALLQRLANPGATDAAAALGNGVEALDRKTMRKTHRAQHPEAAGALLAETEIVAYKKVPDAEFFDQNPADELGCLDVGENGIEPDQKHPVDATAIDCLKFLTKACQPRGRLLRTEKLHWLRLEGDDHRRQIKGPGTLSQRREHGLVPEMNAVEIADSGNAVAVGCAQVVQSPDQ
jgi:hypothetical protein